MTMTNQWKYAHCIKKGLRREESTACQDFICTVEDENCIVTALCEGVESKPSSAAAAEFTAAAACRMLQNCAKSDFRPHVTEKDELLQAILKNIEALLQKRLSDQGIERGQADCTLAFVCVSKAFHFCYVVCLGNSAVCLIQRTGCRCITSDHEGDTVGMQEPWLHAKQAVIDCEDDCFLGAILSSDGLSGEIYTKNTNAVHKAAELYFNAIFADDFEEAASERMDVLRSEYGDSFDDDFAVAVISRSPRKVLLPEDPNWLCLCGERNPLEDTYCPGCDRDFDDVYRRIKFEKFGGKRQFFRYANAHPDFERRAIGLTAQ